jgi:hypothetical protein
MYQTHKLFSLVGIILLAACNQKSPAGNQDDGSAS